MLPPSPAIAGVWCALRPCRTQGGKLQVVSTELGCTVSEIFGGDDSGVPLGGVGALFWWF